MTLPYPTPPFTAPSPSESSYSIPTTSEPVFSVATTEPVFNNAKFPYLKKDEYETWAMKMEYWIMNNDHSLWNIVLHGNSRKRTSRDPRGNIMILPPLAVKARFGGNKESKKMRKSMLKQEFADFKISKSEGLHKGYDRFQKVLSQLNQMQARPDNEDCNMKFLRALPPSWSQVAITLKTKGGLDFLSFDDLYNKLRTLEIDVKGGSSYDSRVPVAPTQSAFISAISTNSKWSTADSKCQPSSVRYTTTSSSADASGNVLENVLYSFVAESDLQQQITYEDFDQIGKFEKKAGRKFKFNAVIPAVDGADGVGICQILTRNQSNEHENGMICDQEALKEIKAKLEKEFMPPASTAWSLYWSWMAAETPRGLELLVSL
ncbi:hypothetical protein Tco_0595145 [Tanacetum coccineum]